MLYVYRITDSDWYAAPDFVTAKQLAAADMGCSPDDAVDWAAATGEPLPPGSDAQVCGDGTKTIQD